MSGLAGKVRRAVESDEFDLANYDQARCDDLAKGAFSEAFPLKNMVRLSFVVGGGKLVRQKYTDDLPKLFMSSLSAVGYVNDDSAAVEVGSAGKYKFQHDTGKNLKFVHVFPKLAPDAGGEGPTDADEEEEDDRPAQPLSREEIVLRSSPEQFERICSEHLPTYGQRKNVLDFLKERIAKWNAIDEKVRNCQKFSAEEDEVYNSDISIDEIQEKDKVLSAKIQDMIEAGRLTSDERQALLSSLEAKLQQIEKAGKKAPQKLADTIKQVKDCGCVGLPPLRYADEVRKHYKRVTELTRLENMLKGKLGSVEQMKALGEKPEHEEALSVYTERSKGWFEDEKVFKQRVEECLKSAPVAPPKKAAGGSGGYGGGSSAARPNSSGGFTTVTGGSRQAKTKVSGPATRNAFGALG